MLVSLSTLLARARRQRQAIPCFEITTPEILVGIMRAAEARNEPVILQVNSKKTGIIPSYYLTSLAVLMAHHASHPATVIAGIASDSQQVEAALAAGAPALMFNDSDQHSRRSFIEMTKWAVERTRRTKAEVVGVLPGLTIPNKLTAFMEETGVQSLCLAIGIVQNQRTMVSLSYVQEMAKLAKVPLLAQELPMGTQLLKKAITAGITSFTVSGELEDAYTAGIRTALRNRSFTEPSQYQSLGVKAVQQAVTHYFVHTK